MAVDAEHRRFVEAATGGVLTSVERAGTGGSRLTYLVEVERRGVVFPYVLRVEGSGSFTGTELTLAREAVVYRTLAGTGVPIAALVAESPSGDALVLERLAGDSHTGGLPVDEQSTVLSQLAVALARLHALDVDALDLPGFARPASPEEHARIDLAMWRRFADAYLPDREPLIRYVEGWLWERAPRRVARTSLAHGDAGPGNVMADGAHLTGLVDWELAHLGDPVDDLAWVRWRCEGLPVDVDAFLADYAAASGTEIDRQSLDYYGIAVPYRAWVIAAMAAARGGGARGWAPYLLVCQRFLGQLADGMARLSGVDAGGLELAIDEPTPRTAWYDHAIETVRAGAKAIADPDLRDEVRNSQILLHVLRQHDRVGAELDAAESADVRSTFGADPDGDAIERAGGDEDDVVLAYLLRRRRRDHERWRTILDRERQRR